ncbi:MAG: tRNA uridine-5-carboxymethylaminomethyl(34) synthesis GTPase MnmE [Candidatus Omnitrophica bacterium]|nr:tRNA uridine-5-carboxymethylaminomethyl(34) synthesis GTPase MnmE [Candidatus Omnitrophota bacterium]
MAQLREDDTIAAVATPPGEGGISMIRVSGPRALECLQRLFHPFAKDAPKSFPTHTAQAGWICGPEGEKIDQAVVTFFRAPNSYTGEDTAEICGHGGLKVTRKILEAVLAAESRLAEPGEFTRRAFLNGKMDLTQAEAVLDLIRAKSDLSARAALGQLEGTLSAKLRSIKERLMRVYAHMEAFLDFPEEDIEVYSDLTFAELFGVLEKELRDLAESFRRGALIREGLSCVIAGRPNAGKSSLFNALLARDRALVSEYPGTTRDSLEETVEIGGLALRLVDTAGLGHDAHHPLDRIGMERTLQALEGSQLVLFVIDGSVPLEHNDQTVFDQAVLGRPFLVVLNKSDCPRRADPEAIYKMTGTRAGIEVSAAARSGLDALETAIRTKIEESGLSHESEQITRLRHKSAVDRSAQSLQRARRAFEAREPLDLISADVRDAVDQLAELVGEIYSEDLLDVIFSEFCIGK